MSDVIGPVVGDVEIGAAGAPDPEPDPLPDPEYVPGATVDERRERGLEARKQAPLGRHGGWRPDPARDPIAILEQQTLVRDPDLVPLRHGRMAVSPFAFFRGAAAVMAADLSTASVADLRTQLCGDAHLLNFGMFETSERSLVFGLNDFDETLPGPFEWDVVRLAASIEVAGRDLGFGRGKRERAVLGTVEAYREAMLGFAEMRNVDVWYARLPADRMEEYLARSADRRSAAHVHGQIERALRRNHLRAFDKLVERDGEEIRFVSRPPLLVPVEELLDERQQQRYVEVIREFLRQYRECLQPDRRLLLESYRFVHMARKVVGVGSVGTRAWVVLMIGRDEADPLLLQLKEALPSVLEPYVGRTVYESHGRRVVEGQRLMQTAGDSMLGWYRLRALDDRMHDFYVRQLWDGKASVEVTELTAKGLRAYGRICAWTLARAHARAGDRIAIAAYLGESDIFDRSVGELACTYADITESDHDRLVDAIESGRLDAVQGI